MFFSISCLRNNEFGNSANNTNSQSLYTGLTFFFFCGIQQVLFCLVQCWRTVFSVRRLFPHPRWQPRPARASSKVRKILAEYIPDFSLFRFLCSRCPDDFWEANFVLTVSYWLCVDPPDWVPDEACSSCIACKAPFTVIRRKHHCRSCGKVWWVMSPVGRIHSFICSLSIWWFMYCAPSSFVW